MLKQIEELLIECSQLAGNIYRTTDGQLDDSEMAVMNIQARRIQLIVDDIIRKD